MKYFIFWIIFIQITYSYGISNRRNEHNLQHLDENQSRSKTEKLTIHDDDDDDNLFQENSKHEEQMEHFYYKKFSISKLNDTHSNGSNELVTNYIKDNNFKLIIDSSDKLKWIMNKFFKDYKNKPEFVDNEEDDDDDDDDGEDDDEDEEHEEEDAEENEDEEDTEERKGENEEDHDSNSVGDENDDDDDDNKNKHDKRRNRRHRKKKRNNSRRGSQNLMWR